MQKEILIVGGGFAGINLAKKLSKTEGIHVTLIDQYNYNFFPPLLYQVATGFLEMSNISYPFRKLFVHQKNLNFRMAELLEVQPGQNKVLLFNGEMHYDYLVLATGTESNYFGMENIRKNALSMKTIEDAINIRNYFLLRNEEATLTTNAKEREKLTTVVIAGGGPTGVELAGMLAEMKKNIFYKEYPELANIRSKIYLVDALPTLLAPMSKQAQKYTYESLVKMGVEIKLNTQVKDYVDDQVVFANGETIETKTLLWTAGVSAKTFKGIPETSFGRGKRMLVNEFNEVTGLPGVYAIGDTCLQTSDQPFKDGHPQLAQVAIQQGENLANNIKNQLEGKALKPFSYYDKGSMAIIGNKKAVADLPKPEMHFKGFIAWMMWLFVHLFSLINFRNKIKTLYNWAIAFFTKDQSLRMIVRAGEPQQASQKTNTL